VKTLLIANRGEIALRILRTARTEGWRVIALASDVDRHAAYATLADALIELGDPSPTTSYLNIERILAGARNHGVTAIHPGYGFLSERPEFAEACAEAGITFVGPPASAMRALGDKIQAKTLAEAHGVPTTPGLHRPGATDDELETAAHQIGFPVMLKAAAGGGGRGMRPVTDPARFRADLSTASAEALQAFGNGAMFVEKLVLRPRHIEVQVLADQHGHIAALFERECSLQRRHQKLVEEAPSPIMTPELWSRLREASLALIRAASYVGAATVEFMVDDATRQGYFLEVNARLQVEHPVTEAITGLDLVALQLAIAEGASLADRLTPAQLEGDRAAIVGHAIEARVVAEDPDHDFVPSLGRLIGWAEPAAPGVRVDSGYAEGDEVPRHYDGLLAKVIAHGADRDAARRRLLGALGDFHVLGVRTTIGYLTRVLDHPEFRSGQMDTGALARWSAELAPAGSPPAELAAIFPHAGASLNRREDAKTGLPGPWDLADDWRILPALGD